VGELIDHPPEPVNVSASASTSCHMTCREHRRHWKEHHLWEYRWHHVDSGLKGVLFRLGWCESRNDYHATNGSHWGRFQYSWGGTGSAGWRAGFRVRPDLAAPAEQNVRTAKFWPAHRSEWQCKP
jgi:hypothetical protein